MLFYIYFNKMYREPSNNVRLDNSWQNVYLKNKI